VSDAAALALSRRTLARLGRMARPHAVLPTLLGLGGGLAAIAQAWFVATALAGVLAGQGVAATPLVAAGLLVALRTVLAAMQEAAAFKAGAVMRQHLRQALMARLHALGPAWAEARPAGQLATTLVERTEALEGFFARWIPALSLAALLPVAAALAAFPIDAWIAAGFLAAPVLSVVAMAGAGIGAARASASQFAALARMGGHFLDRMRGLPSLVLLNREADETQRIAAVAEDFRISIMRVLRIAFLSAALLEAVFVTATALVSLKAGMALLAGELPLREGLFLLLLVPEMFTPIRGLAGAYHDRQAATGAAQGLAELFSTEAPAQGGAHLPDGPANVVFERVGFTHPTRERPALENFSLSVVPGETVVLVGESGAGKSTAIDLLMGFRRADAGTVRLNGIDIATVPPEALRAKIAWVGQRTSIIAGTIRDNVMLARPDATEAQLIEALDAAQVSDFARALPDGIDTRIGEGGFGISGGQAQRVALARAFLKDAPLLLLDEPTASLDPETEAALLDALRRLAAGRTVIMASHSAAAALTGRVVRLTAPGA
jgi:ATP-binding cassette subfamily C protein CydD